MQLASDDQALDTKNPQLWKGSVVRQQPDNRPRARP
jgi:hypothetical protein